MKTKAELNALKEEIETLNKKLAELTEDELKEVAGGAGLDSADALLMSDLDIHRTDERTCPRDTLK